MGIIGKVNFEQLKKHMTSGEKESDGIRADNFEGFKQGLESSYNAQVTAAEMSSNVEITARVGGKITLKLLSAKNDKELPDKGVVTRAVHADAELFARNIEMTEDDWTKLDPETETICPYL